jgi:hypothetical protein
MSIYDTMMGGEKKMKYMVISGAVAGAAAVAGWMMSSGI